MILLCGIPSETPLRLVAEAAARRGIETVMLNQRTAATTDLELRICRAGCSLRLHGAGTARALDGATGAYVRLMDYRELPEYALSRPRAELARRRIAAWHALLSDWLEAAPFLVMNRLRPSNSNMSKPYQAQLIARAGFATPRTLITNRPEAVLQFWRSCGRIVFKSISAHRSIVRELTPEAARRLNAVRALPTQFQEYVPGDDVRVHVVGDAVFATRIRSAAVDYRYAADDGLAADFTPMILPEDLAGRCRGLARALDLPLCGIDLKSTPSGRYVCLEVNPSPAFSSFEQQTGQPIADAIAVSLARADAGTELRAVPLRS